jgi:hypothetical protein
MGASKNSVDRRAQAIARAAYGARVVSDDLTCSEEQVEDLLSEGESTENDNSRSQKRSARKASSGKIVSGRSSQERK